MVVPQVVVLTVGDRSAARRFYVDLLGLAELGETPRGLLVGSPGRPQPQIALVGQDIRLRPELACLLRALVIAQGGGAVRLPAVDWTRAEDRLRALGMDVAERELRDPWGNRLRLEVSSP